MDESKEILYRRVKALGPLVVDPPEGATMMWTAPVEPCKHGNYARHLDPDAYGRRWCPGVPGKEYQDG